MNEPSSHGLVDLQMPSADKWSLSLVVAPDSEFPITVMLPAFIASVPTHKETLYDH